MLSMKSLQEKKESLKAKTNSLKDKIQQEKISVKDLETVLHNIDAILNREAVFTHEHTRKVRNIQTTIISRNRRRRHYDRFRIQTDLR